MEWIFSTKAIESDHFILRISAGKWLPRFSLCLVHQCRSIRTFSFRVELIDFD
jgi:hypothetical protein